MRRFHILSLSVSSCLLFAACGRSDEPVPDDDPASGGRRAAKPGDGLSTPGGGAPGGAGGVGDAAGLGDAAGSGGVAGSGDAGLGRPAPTPDAIGPVNAVPQVVISEVMARNSTGLLDEDKDRSSWIELRNVSTGEIMLAGWTLVVGKARWVLPAARIAAGQYLIVFASGKDRRDPAKPLHTNSKIDADGEGIWFLRPNGSVDSMITVRVAVRTPDVSYAPIGGQGAPVFFEPATPSATNGPPLTDFTEPPIVAGAHGLFEAATEVRLTSMNPAASLRYTTDGSTPTNANGTIYAGPITVAKTTVIRARAFKVGLASSPTVTVTYIFPADVIRQVFPQPPPGWPASGAVNGQAFRYGFQPRVRGGVADQDLIEALRKLPSLSVVTDQSNLTGAKTGVYVNASLKGQEWERPASIELIAEGEPGFQIDAGLRIRGGNSRLPGFVKHSFRLFFRKSHGRGALKYALHPDGGSTSEFRELDLRSEQNYSWANGGGNENTAVREVFTRDLMGAAGQPQTRSRYIHLYLNGLYWGVYETEESGQENFGASYFGGSADDYDVVKTSNHPDFVYEVSNGTVDIWRRLWDRARAHAANPTPAGYFALLGRGPDGKVVPDAPVYVDVDNLITYLLVNYYTGDGDSPLSNFLKFNQGNNWRCMRSRVANVGFRCLQRDGEHTLLAPAWVANRAVANTTGGSNRSNFMYSNPEWIHEDLARSQEYRVRIGDVAQRLLFNDGAFTPQKARALFDVRATQVAPGIISDIVRWGSSPDSHTLAQWRARIDSIRRDFFPNRPAQVLSQLRARGFYPMLATPTFSLRGGRIPSGSTLTLEAGQPGTIYYTIDGTDPRSVGGTPAGQAYSGTPLAITAPMTVKARLTDGQGAWSALDEVKFESTPTRGLAP